MSFLFLVIARVAVIPLKIPMVRLRNQIRASVFIHQNFISLKYVVHISFPVKGIFQKIWNVFFV